MKQEAQEKQEAIQSEPKSTPTNLVNHGNTLFAKKERNKKICPNKTTAAKRLANDNSNGE